MTVPHSATLRIASYNIRKAVGTDRRRDPARVLGVIADLNADIVVLQEADRRLGARPSALPIPEIEPQTGLVPIPVATNKASLGWHGNGLLLGPGWQMLHLHRLPLPGLEPRGAVRVEFDTPIGPLRVIGMHLGLISYYRQQQVLHLCRELGDLPGMPTVWAGDFNDWSRAPVMERWAPRMRFLPPRPSFPSARPVGALDRIALSDELTVAGHGVHSARPAHIASDHLPVWADLRAQESGRVRPAG